MQSKSIKGVTPAAIKVALEKSMEDGFQPTLAFVFMSIKLDRAAVCRIFKEANIAIYGATTAGEFTDQKITNEAAAILLLEIDTTAFRLILEEYEPETVMETARKIARKGKEIFNNPAYIVSASHLEVPHENIVEGFVSEVGKDINMLGGNAADDYIMSGSYVFTNDKHSERGILTLVLDQEKVIVEGLAVSGWKPVGTPKTVTKSEGCWLFTIDDQPALDVLMKYTGIEINMEDKGDVYVQLGATFPLQVLHESGSPIMKPPLLFNRENKAVFIGGIIPQGSKIRFSLPPDFEVVDAVVNSAKKIKSTRLPKADAMVIFSCCGRLGAFGPLIDDEIKGLSEVWEVPMAGFFTYGEYGKTESGHTDYHGTTCSWVALKEK